MIQRTASLRSWAESFLSVSSTMCGMGAGHALDSMSCCPHPLTPHSCSFWEQSPFLARKRRVIMDAYGAVEIVTIRKGRREGDGWMELGGVPQTH